MRKDKPSTPRSPEQRKKSRKTSTQEALGAKVQRPSTNNRDEVRDVTTHRQGHPK